MTGLPMSTRGRTPRLLVAGAAVCICVLASYVDAAFAREPWWRVDVVSAPASQPGNEGLVLLEAGNVGDAPVNGFSSPVTISAVLPAGVTPTAASEEGGGSFPIGINGVKEVAKCAKIEGQAVSCSYAGPLLSYERLIVAVRVQVEPGAGGGPAEVSVSGGGAQPLTVQRPLSLTDSLPAFGLQDYQLIPETEDGSVDTRAGGHPFQLTTTLTFNTKATLVFVSGEGFRPEAQPITLVKDLRFDLPPGMIGNVSALPKCRLSVFVKQSNNVRCPDDTAIGVATPILDNIMPAAQVPLAESVPVYSLEPAYGEPARFGFTTQGGPVVLDTGVRTGGDYGVVVSVPDIPDDVGFIASRVSFWGDPDDSSHDTSRGACLDEYEGTVKVVKQWEFACPVQGENEPFLTMPTSCTGPWISSVEGDSWEAAGSFDKLGEYSFKNLDGAPLGEDGCDLLAFDPSISVTPDTTEGSSASGLSVGVHVDQQASLNPTGRADATVRDTTVTLPPGVLLNPAAANGQGACTQAEIALSSPAEQTCPDSSKIGTLELTTPLLPERLSGSAYLAQQEANPFGSLLAIYLVVYDPISGVRVKLAGEVTPDPITGQLTSVFKDTPELPFEDLTLTFFGGADAPLSTPALCGSYSTAATITPWSSSLPALVTSPGFTVQSGPGGSPCSNPLPFAPTLAAGSTNLQGGGFTPFTTTMSRSDGQQSLDGVRLTMPPGLLGDIATVKTCDEASANAGTCGPESLIGETTVSVGVGGEPYTVTGGKVYVTGPYKGAPYGLSIVNPAKAGPFDLENTKSKHPACDCLVVRASIQIDPITSALTIASDTSGPYSIPTILEGIPLQIKHVNVTVNRPGFTFNPTNCGPMSIAGTLTSDHGATATVKLPFQVSNCSTLQFKPKLAVSTNGKTSRRNGASLHVKLTYPQAPLGTQANIAKVKVDLPKQLPSRLSTLQKACADRIFEQNPAACPAGSVVGTARATTPILLAPLTGPAYFVSHGGAKFPELVIVLTGENGVVVQLHGETFINEKTGITSSTFRAIPDVPVGTFELNLPQGADSALAANTNLCGVKKLSMPTMFVAANGASIKSQTQIKVTNCKKKPKKTKKRR